MLKELIQFTNALGDLKEIGEEPKFGLYIQLKIKNDDGHLSMDSKDYKAAVYSKSTASKKGTPTELSEEEKKKEAENKILLEKCQIVIKHGWMIDTWKCFDPSAKTIHTCSPYAVGFKRNTLEGGSKSQPHIGDRLNKYFEKAGTFLLDDAERGRMDVFKNLINSKEKLNTLLDSIPEFVARENADPKKDGEKFKKEYIVLFLDEPTDVFKAPNDRYLAKNLFNKADYTLKDIQGESLGASNFFHGVKVKKPFESHQTAAFQISGRISLTEAQRLNEFEKVLKRNVLPRPLPIFIYQDELPERPDGLKESISVFTKEAEIDPKNRRGFSDIMGELHTKGVELANFYLLFYSGGDILDFDFVSKFEYKLDGWKIENLFELKEPPPKFDKIFDILEGVLVDLFDNSLVVRSSKKEALSFRWFGDVEAKYCRSESAYLRVLKYRHAFYEFIYKSRRQAVTQTMFEDLAMSGILDGIRRDRYEKNHHTEEGDIKRKLNLLFSLHQKFTPHTEKSFFMPNQTTALREFMGQLTEAKTDITDDPQFAFAAGQVVRYLLSKSKSSDRSFARLEPFLQQTHISRFLDAVRKVFETYKHEKFSRKFEHPFSEVTGYKTETNLRELTPLFLSGFFSKNSLFADKKVEPEVALEENED